MVKYQVTLPPVNLWNYTKIDYWRIEMNREDQFLNRNAIIQMAREAGMEQDGDNFFSPSHEEIDVHITDLERFAALVAAAEREACAKVCDGFWLNGRYLTDVADSIRARGAVELRGETK